MIYIYLFYGTAFILLGTLALLQARTTVLLLPTFAMIYLGLFGLIHGSGEWLDMARRIEGPGCEYDFVIARAAASAATISFAFLVGFGVELLVVSGKWAWQARFAPLLFLFLWGITVLLWVGVPSHDPADPRFAAMDALGRYLIGFPGACLAAFGFWVVSRDRSDVARRRIRRFFGLASFIFAAYAVFAGLVVSPADFLPASLINTETFQSMFGFPVLLLRACCAAALALILSQAFTVELSHVQNLANQSREHFISMVAHDLRSPVTAIGTGAELLDKIIGELRLPPETLERARTLLRHISTSSQNLKRMISDLLDASLLDANRLSIQRTKTEMVAFLRQVVERNMAGESRPVLFDLPDDPVYAEIDPERIEQVIGNLLSNARKYSPAETEIEVSAELRETEIEIAVTDQGGLIPQSEQSRIFDRFYRSGQVGQVKGAGLGLYISKGLVEAHGGRIWVESQPGSHTTFRFTVPASST